MAVTVEEYSFIPYAESIETTDKKQLSLKISSVDGRTWYLLVGRTIINEEVYEINNIDDYVLRGGPLEPFENITIRIPSKKLEKCAPDLVNVEGILSGRNKVYLDYYGTCKFMTVSDVDTGNDTITVTAYCDAQLLTLTKLPGEVSGTPFNIIRTILGNRTILSTPFLEGSDTSSSDFIYCYNTNYDRAVGTITIKAGEFAWFALQICAISLGCILFFANDKAYLIDYRARSLVSNNGEYMPIFDVGALALYINIGNNPLSNRIIGRPEYTKDQVDTVVNYVSVKGIETKLPKSGTKITESTIDAWDIPSVSLIGRKAKQLDTKYLNYMQRAYFAKNYLDYHLVTSTGVSFSVNELSTKGDAVYWNPLFYVVSRTRFVSDGYTDKTTINEDVLGNPMLQKIFLSSFEVEFPKGVTRYVFGKMVNHDLPQALSELNTVTGV